MKKRSEELANLLSRVIGASTDLRGALVVSPEGLVLNSELSAKMDQNEVGAISAGLLKLSEKAVDQLGQGAFTQALIQGEAGNIIITEAGSNALVALAAKDVNLGMAFLEAKEASQAVASLLSESIVEKPVSQNDKGPHQNESAGAGETGRPARSRKG